MKNLYKFYADCGRMGNIQGLFIATQEKVDSIIGKVVYFGEVLGKHSDIQGDMEAKYFTLVSSDQDKIEWLYLSNFIKWVDSQPNRDWVNCEPDKDILIVGNKHYSPETVIFVEKRINTFVLNCGKSRGSCMLGVIYVKDSKINPYRAQINNPFTKRREHIGLFPTELDAHLAWKAKKLEFARELAKDIVDAKVKEALLHLYSENSDLTNI